MQSSRRGSCSATGQGRACAAVREEWSTDGAGGGLLAHGAAYAVFYGMWSVRKYHAYHAPGFRHGHLRPGLWLLSRFKEPFVTILGLNLFGDHSSFILVFLVPLYWIWPDPETLLVVQTMALAVGAVPSLSARAHGASKPLAGSHTGACLLLHTGAGLAEPGELPSRQLSRCPCCSSPCTSWCGGAGGRIW